MVESKNDTIRTVPVTRAFPAGWHFFFLFLESAENETFVGDKCFRLCGQLDDSIVGHIQLPHGAHPESGTTLLNTVSVSPEWSGSWLGEVNQQHRGFL